MLEEGANLIIHDPKVEKRQIEIDLGLEELNKYPESEISSYEIEGSWQGINNLDEAFVDSYAVLITTEWEDYKNIDWHYVAKQMRRPAWIFDARSIINPKILLILTQTLEDW